MLLVAAALAADISVVTDGPLPADGETDSVVQVFVPGLPDGEEVKLSAKGARIVDDEVGPQGTIRVTLRPAAVDAPASVGLTVRGKGFGATLEVPVVPRPGHLGIDFDPVALQGDGGVLVKIRPTGAVGKLVLTTSLGRVSEPSPAADGTWSAFYSPPAGLERPVAVLFTAVDLADPERIVGQGVLPIRVRMNRSLPAPPDADATLRVGDRTYGPVRANTGGVAVFAADMWPGDKVGELSWVGFDTKTHTITVDLENPAPPQVAFAPWPAGTGVPGGETVTLWLAATDAAGVARERVPDLVVTGPNGPRSTPAEDGWHRIEVVAPEEPGPFEVTATLGLVSTSLSLRAVPPIPVVDVSAAPPVPQQGNEVAIDARFATGAAGRSLQVQVLDAPAVADGGHAQVDLTGKPAVTAVVGTTFEPTGLPAARLRMWTGRPSFAASERVPLFVVVEDALGVPVPGQVVRLMPDSSLSDVPVTVDTGPSGWAMVPIGRSDDRAEPIVVQGESGALRGAAVVWVHGGPLGTADDVLMRQKWGRGLPVLYVRRDGPPQGTATEAVAPRTRPAPEPEPGPAPEPKRPIGREIRRIEWIAGVGYADAGVRQHQTSSDPDVLPEARVREPLPFGAVGVFARGEAWHPTGFGAEIGARIGGYRFEVEGDSIQDRAGAWWLGARYRRPITEVFGWQVLLGMQRTDTVAFAWDSDQAHAQKRHLPITGIRVGGAGTAEFSIVRLRLEVAETFGWAPVITDVGVLSDFALPVDLGGVGLYALAGLDMSFRYLNRDIGEGVARVNELQGVVTIGIAVGSPPM